MFGLGAARGALRGAAVGGWRAPVVGTRLQGPGTVVQVQRRWIKPPRTIETPSPDWALRRDQWHFTGADRHIRKLCEQRGLFRDAVGAFTPSINLRVSFGDHSVVCGSAVPASVTIPEPVLALNGDPSALYSVVMVDLDQPSNFKPTERSFLHWVVTNLRGDGSEEGTTVAEYIPPCPAMNTGSHRIAIVVLQQAGALPSPAACPSVAGKAMEGRGGFRLAAFAKANQLTPVGVSFFQSRYDPSVDAVYEQAGKTMPHFVDLKTVHKVSVTPHVEGSRYRAQHL